MIAYLVGKPLFQENNLVILVNGVGYEVKVSQKTQTKISDTPKIELFIYTHVKEDAFQLYGFEQLKEKELFIKLISVSGVGPKTAINMFDKGAESLIKAVQNADVTFFKSFPRIGKKLAQKIIIELKSKLGSLRELNLGPVSQKQQDVLEALAELGFSDDDITQIANKLNFDQLTVEQAIKQAMKLMTRNS